jgi:carbamoyltransferase
MNVLGISCHFHDAAAALVADGEVVAAAAEERFTRIKHDPEFPHQAIRFCLDRAGLLASELDAVIFYEKPIRKLDRILTSQIVTFPWSLPAFLQAMPQWLRRKLLIGRQIAESLYSGAPIFFADHHASHAAAAFLTSPFERAALLTVDGVGEWCTTSLGVGEGSSVRLEREIRFPHSLGLFYSALTHYLGFRVNSEEWKVMALGAFGQPRYRDALGRVLEILDDGSFRLRLEYFGHYRDPRVLFTPRVERLLGFPPRGGEPLRQEHYDLASSGQALLEEALLKTLRFLRTRYDVPDLCLSGGVALNCLANGRLLREGPFERIWVPPAPGDDGGAVGAALFAWGVFSGADRQPRRFRPLLGPDYPARDIHLLLEHEEAEVFDLTPEDIVERAVEALCANQVIGWFQGRMEFGPRALGSRSILANPADPSVKERINTSIKRREPFRPLAPAILRERVSDYFLDVPESPFMSFVARVRPERARAIPAVLHVDGTARLQTVEREDNPLFHKLLATFYQRTGLPMLLNTSLNVEGQPIACSPADALQAARQGGLDEIYLGGSAVELHSASRVQARAAASR